MCLAVPMKLVEINAPEAMVELGGVKRKIHLALLDPKDLELGDYVIVHAGFAIQKLDREDAEERLKIFQKMVDIQ